MIPVFEPGSIDCWCDDKKKDGRQRVVYSVVSRFVGAAGEKSKGTTWNQGRSEPRVPRNAVSNRVHAVSCKIRRPTSSGSFQELLVKSLLRLPPSMSNHNNLKPRRSVWCQYKGDYSATMYCCSVRSDHQRPRSTRSINLQADSKEHIKCTGAAPT